MPHPRLLRMYPIGTVERPDAGDFDPEAFYDPALESILVIDERWAE